MIGGGAHEAVRNATAAALRAADDAIPALSVGQPMPLPTAQHLRLYCRAGSQLLVAGEERIETALARDDALGGFARSMNDVLTHLRLVSERGA
jgi:hypothetical protein